MDNPILVIAIAVGAALVFGEECRDRGEFLVGIVRVLYCIHCGAGDSRFVSCAEDYG